MSDAAPAVLPFRVLAVCSGNVCRSPLLELLLRRALGARADLEVVSAGTIARPGMRMTREMVRVAARAGVAETDARAHAARRLDEHTVASAGLILGLTREHRAAAVELHPAALRRAFTLSEFARLATDAAAETPAPGGAPDEPRRTAAELVAELAARRGGAPPVAPERDDIRDPIGLPQEVYDEVGAEIEGAARVVAGALLATRAGAAQASVLTPQKRGPALSFTFPRL